MILMILLNRSNLNHTLLILECNYFKFTTQPHCIFGFEIFSIMHTHYLIVFVFKIEFFPYLNTLLCTLFLNFIIKFHCICEKFINFNILSKLTSPCLVLILNLFLLCWQLLLIIVKILIFCSF